MFNDNYDGFAERNSSNDDSDMEEGSGKIDSFYSYSDDEEMDQFIYPKVKKELLQDYPFSLPKDNFLSSHSKFSPNKKRMEPSKLTLTPPKTQKDKLDETEGKDGKESSSPSSLSKSLLDPLIEFFKTTTVMDCCPPSSLVLALSNKLTIKEALLVISDNKVPHAVLVDDERVQSSFLKDNVEDLVCGMVTATDLVNILIFLYETPKNEKISKKKGGSKKSKKKKDIFQMTICEWREMMLLKKEMKIHERETNLSKQLLKAAALSSTKKKNLKEEDKNLMNEEDEHNNNNNNNNGKGNGEEEMKSPSVPFQGLDREVNFIGEQDCLWKAIELFAEKRIHRLPVLNKEKTSILSILSDSDILTFFCMFFSSVKVLPDGENSNNNSNYDLDSASSDLSFDFSQISLDEKDEGSEKSDDQNYLSLPIFRKRMNELGLFNNPYGGVVTVKKTDNLYKALKKFSRFQVSILPIIDPSQPNGSLIVDVITKHDIVSLVRGFFFNTDNRGSLISSKKKKDALNLEISVMEALKISRKCQLEEEKKKKRSNFNDDDDDDDDTDSDERNTRNLLMGFSGGDDFDDEKGRIMKEDEFILGDSQEENSMMGIPSYQGTTVMRFICKREEELGRVIKHLTGIHSHRLVCVDEENRMLGVVAVSDIFRFLVKSSREMNQS